MKDEQRECLCGKPHPWGILRLSEDNVPLYGARAISTCDNYRPVAVVDEGQLPANAAELWAQTGDLNPQATAATRLVVAKLRALAKGKGTYTGMAAQFPEFVGFVISQITDLRGTLVRDESKFARLVAHTDEIVRAMEGVAQLAERLALMNDKLNHLTDAVDELRRSRGDIDRVALDHFGLDEFQVGDEPFGALQSFDLQMAMSDLFKLSNLRRDEPVVIDADINDPLESEDD